MCALPYFYSKRVKNGGFLVDVLRYAAILLDISDMSREDFDELLIEQKRSVVWIHFAVRPSGNRRRTSLRLRSLLQRS